VGVGPILQQGHELVRRPGQRSPDLVGKEQGIEQALDIAAARSERCACTNILHKNIGDRGILRERTCIPA